MLPQYDLSGNTVDARLPPQRGRPELIVLRIADRRFF
jgi:hypothetical protein